MSLLRWLLTLFLFASLASCCAKPRTPPPPISLDEQISRLSAWSHQIPYISAKTVLAGVHLQYQDANGAPQSNNAEGTLVFLQPFAGVANPPQKGEVLLLGTILDQPAFDAGRNDEHWWFAIRLGDNKTAYAGDASRPVDLSSLNNPQSHSMLRADLVLDLLALSDLPGPGPLAARSQFIVFRVNDEGATNDLFIQQIGPDGRPFIARQIIVDRFTDEVREVRLYDPNGVLVVQSKLSDYVPVKYPEDATKPAQPPRFPRKIAVTYPAQKMAVSLEFDAHDLTLKPPRSAAFRTPDWEKENLRVIQVR